jgi:hypothetical protein
LQSGPYSWKLLFFCFLISPRDKLQLDPCIWVPCTQWSLVSNLINSILN